MIFVKVIGGILLSVGQAIFHERTISSRGKCVLADKLKQGGSSLLQISRSKSASSHAKSSGYSSRTSGIARFEESASLEQPKRALLAIYGLQNRDQGCAVPSHLLLRDNLRSAGFHVDIFVYEMKPQMGDMIDGVSWSFGSLQNISTIYQSESTSVVDESIFSKCGGEDMPSCRFYKYGDHDPRYQPPLLIQALRQLYSEQVVARYLKLQAQDKYQVVVAVGSDIYFRHGIAKIDIRQAAQVREHLTWLYVSPNCYCGGYTNGFYMGNMSAVALAMDRFDFNNDAISGEYINYEAQLKGFVDAAGLHVENLTDHSFHDSFAKLRHNGSWKYSLDPVLQSSVETCYRAAQENHAWWR